MNVIKYLKKIGMYPETHVFQDTFKGSVKAFKVSDVLEDYAKIVNKNYNTNGVMPPLKSINFREMRKDNGLTLKKVEEITGVSNAYLSQLENGKIKSPGYNVVKSLYDLYNNHI